MCEFRPVVIFDEFLYAIATENRALHMQLSRIERSLRRLVVYAQRLQSHPTMARLEGREGFQYPYIVEPYLQAIGVNG